MIKDMEDQEVMKTDPPKDIKKLILVVIYWAFALTMSSIMTVIVHDRLPQIGKVSQLRDVFLERIEYRFWALPMCEVIIVILIISCMLLCILHKHR